MDGLVAYVKSTDNENAVKAIVAYGNKRETKGITETWRRAIIVLRKAFKRREKRIKDSMLEYDPEIGAISMMSFVRYFAAIEDQLRNYQEIGSREVKNCAADVNDFMYQVLGDVKIDRRILFGKDQ